jgi:hypothetical protein
MNGVIGKAGERGIRAIEKRLDFIAGRVLPDSFEGVSSAVLI